MFIPFIIVLGGASLLLDAFLYYRVRRRSPGRTMVRRTYVAVTLILYLLILLSFLLYRYGSRDYEGLFSHGRMWAVWFLLLNVAPKLVYFLLSAPDYPIQWLRRKKTRWFNRAGLAAGAFVLAIMLWGNTAGRNCIRITEVEIPSDRLPESFDGFRIALIADLHLGNYSGGNTLVRRTVERINLLQPDLIAVAGDVVHRRVHDLTPEYRQVLSGLRARHGVYSVLGNHDLGVYMRKSQRMSPEESVRELIAAEKAMGWRVLLNETRLLGRGDDTISVSGMTYPRNARYRHRGRDAGPDEIGRDIPTRHFSLLIAHTPENWEEILRETPADLTLAGHVHAMQVKYRIGKGRGWSPAVWMYPRWSGLYEEDDRFLYINDGIGYVMLPMRIGTRPEITVLTLRAMKRSSDR